MPSGEPRRYTIAGVNLCEVELDSLGIQNARSRGFAEGRVSAAMEARPRPPLERAESKPPEAAAAPLRLVGAVPVIEVKSSDEQDQGCGQPCAGGHSEPQLPSDAPEAAPLDAGSDASASGGTRSTGQTSWYNLDTGRASEANSLLAAPSKVCDMRISCHSKCGCLPEYAVPVLDECRIENGAASTSTSGGSGGASNTPKSSSLAFMPDRWLSDEGNSGTKRCGT